MNGKIVIIGKKDDEEENKVNPFKFSIPSLMYCIILSVKILSQNPITEHKLKIFEIDY